MLWVVESEVVVSDESKRESEVIKPKTSAILPVLDGAAVLVKDRLVSCRGRERGGEDEGVGFGG